MPLSQEQKHLLTIIKSGLKAADPYHAVKNAVCLRNNKLFIGPDTYDLDRFSKVVVIGAGKATAQMALGIEDIMGGAITHGLIVVKYGHTASLTRVRQVEAGHPVPDENGVKGTKEIIELLKSADENTLVIFLLSGGGSALLVAPAQGITLTDKKITTNLLLKSGASIDEINTVRKHMSRVKGGRIAEIAHPATIATLIISDVIGNRLDTIASGPTVPDGTTFAHAMGIVEKYSLKRTLPPRVLSVLKKGAQGRIADTPKGSEGFFKKAHVLIIGSLQQAIEAAKEKARALGLEPEIVTSELQGEARDAARYLAARALEAQNSLGRKRRPRCLIAGGETTVTVRGKGLGGRNQELALAFALEIEKIDGIIMLSSATDGTDGPTDAAGAIVDGAAVPLARKLGLIPEDYLNENDSYHFFQKLDSLSGSRCHFKTGPTGTNVMDMQIILVGR